MNKILLIVEGDKTEQKIMERYAKLLEDFNIEIVSFGTNIYTLYSKMAELNNEFSGNDSTSTIEILKVIFEEELARLIVKRNQSVLNGQSAKDIRRAINRVKKNIEKLKEKYPYIFLIFDCEYQDNKYVDKLPILTKMRDYFNDETDNGLLLINYPMVEAFKDYTKPSPDETFRDKLIKIDEILSYKTTVGLRGNNDHLKDYSLEEFHGIIQQNIKKINYILNGNFEYLSYSEFIDVIYNNDILNRQFDFIINNDYMYILCCSIFTYVVFLSRDYYSKIIGEVI